MLHCIFIDRENMKWKIKWEFPDKLAQTSPILENFHVPRLLPGSFYSLGLQKSGVQHTQVRHCSSCWKYNQIAHIIVTLLLTSLPVLHTVFFTSDWTGWPRCTKGMCHKSVYSCLDDHLLPLASSPVLEYKRSSVSTGWWGRAENKRERGKKGKRKEKNKQKNAKICWLNTGSEWGIEMLEETLLHREKWKE